MSFSERQAADRRGIILRGLDEGGHRLAEGSLRRVLDLTGYLISQEELRADLEWLERAVLVRVDREPAPHRGPDGGEVWLVQLLEAGQLVARGRSHPGVGRQAYAPPR